MSNSNYIVQTLIEDENMPSDLASLYPAASRIADSASTFIDKADQAFDKKNLMGKKAEIVARCIDICQNVVKEGAAINKLLRNPNGSMQAVDDRQREERARQQDIDDVTVTVEDDNPRQIGSVKQ